MPTNRDAHRGSIPGSLPTRKPRRTSRRPQGAAAKASPAAGSRTPPTDRRPAFFLSFFLPPSLPPPSRPFSLSPVPISLPLFRRKPRAIARKGLPLKESAGREKSTAEPVERKEKRREGRGGERREKEKGKGRARSRRRGKRGKREKREKSDPGKEKRPPVPWRACRRGVQVDVQVDVQAAWRPAPVRKPLPRV